MLWKVPCPGQVPAERVRVRRRAVRACIGLSDRQVGVVTCCSLAGLLPLSGSLRHVAGSCLCCKLTVGACVGSSVAAFVERDQVAVGGGVIGVGGVPVWPIWSAVCCCVAARLCCIHSIVLWPAQAGFMQAGVHRSGDTWRIQFRVLQQKDAAFRIPCVFIHRRPPLFGCPCVQPLVERAHMVGSFAVSPPSPSLCLRGRACA